MYLKSLLHLFLITNCIWAAQILGVVHVPMHSHHRLMDTIFQELAARGHEVTAITPFKENHKVQNLKSIELTDSIEKFSENQRNLFTTGPKSALTKYQLYEIIGLNITEEVLANKDVQNLLKSDKVFDLIIIDHNFNEALKGFCHHYNAPCVSVTTFASSRWSNPQMGNPGPPSYVPDIMSGFSSKMSFLERLYNVYLYVMGEILTHAYLLPQHNKILKKYFPNAPGIYDITYNVSLMLVNSHFSMNSAVPYVPNVIEIGGIHISPPKKLPNEVQEFLDGAKHGAIYFSFGTLIKTSSLPLETVKGILKIFSTLRQHVLWKWDQHAFLELPKNVMLKKWWPQSDILAHPNIKLFITHGGQLSTTETIYHGVPILGIPVFADQDLNIENAVRAGYAIGLPFKDFNLKRFESALNEILNNTTYLVNAKNKSKIFHDRPMKPLDTAMYWIEYVLRHRGAPHLRSVALQLAWYQYYLLDIIGAFLVALLTIVGLFWKIMKYCFSKKNLITLKKLN